MATYRPDQLGIKPPAGGFQQGGWYNGRQYWNGSLSEPGVIHPESDQQGAGREVDKEVIDQSGPNNYDYIEREREKARKLHDSIDQGTGLPVVNKPYKPPVSNKPGAGSGSGATLPTFTTPTIDLNSIYSKLYESSGISNIERSLADLDKKLASMKSGYDAAMSNINDNPFLSEASRVGRASKLSTDFQNSIAGVEQEYARRKDDIIRQKADIEAKMNIELKQFDINSQQAQQALQQFNSLLSMGALSGASAEDIAGITKATGISSSMIQAAIDAYNQKNVETSIINYDDGTNQGYVVIDKNTGEIISKQQIAASKPKDDGMTPTQQRSLIGDARTILAQVDSGYETINGQLKKIDTTYETARPDKRLSLQEYQQAVQDLMAKSGIDFATADDLLSQAMDDFDYTRWRW